MQISTTKKMLWT